MNWEKADAIELLDVGRFCLRKGCTEEPTRAPDAALYSVYGYELVHLARMFGVDVDKNTPIERYNTSKGTRTRRAGDIDFNVYPGDPEDWESDTLEAALEGGFLHYRIGYKDDETGEIKTWEYSYSGRFVVHWARLEVKF